MAQRPYRHRIEETHNKHSRAVFREGMIVIRLAHNLSTSERQQHIQSLLKRMYHLLMLEERDKVKIHPFESLLNGGQQQTVTLATGKKYLFRLQPGKHLRAVRRGNIWTVSVSPNVRRRGLHRFLWNVIAHAEERRIRHLVHDLNAGRMQVTIRSLVFGFASSQWGSCSPRGKIMINTALLFVPPSLLKYVIIHELSHRLRGDHSPSYWRIVEEAMPQYKKARAELLNFRLPSL